MDRKAIAQAFPGMNTKPLQPNDTSRVPMLSYILADYFKMKNEQAQRPPSDNHAKSTDQISHFTDRPWTQSKPVTPQRDRQTDNNTFFSTYDSGESLADEQSPTSPQTKQPQTPPKPEAEKEEGNSADQWVDEEAEEPPPESPPKQAQRQSQTKQPPAQTEKVLIIYFFPDYLFIHSFIIITFIIPLCNS